MIDFIKRFARDERGGFNIGGFFSSVLKTVAPFVPILGPIVEAVLRPSQPSLPGPTVLPARLGGFLPRIGLAAGRTFGSAKFRRSALVLAKELGISAAAIALGITVLELAEIIARGTPRRRRGITARQISTTKATIRRIDSLNRAIAKVCPPASRRRAPSRAAIHHAR